MDGVAVAEMKHSFPPGGICHSFGDLSAKTSGEWPNSFKLPDVLSMETKDISAELAQLGVVARGVKIKANKQETLWQAYINKLPNMIAKAFKQYKNCIYDVLKRFPKGVTFCCSRYKMNVPNFNDKWMNYKDCGKICKDNNVDPKISINHCPGTMSISIVNGFVGVPFPPPPPQVAFVWCNAIHPKQAAGCA
jgi:hypothetical protein